MAARHLDHEVPQPPRMVHLEPEDLAQERGGRRQVLNLEVGPAAQELRHSPMLRRGTPPEQAGWRNNPLIWKWEYW